MAISHRLFTSLAAIAVSLAAAGPAAAQPLVPPEGSGVNQYTETLLGAEGGESTAKIGDRPPATPAKVLGKAEAAHLAALGPTGRAAAQLAATTASAPAAEKPRASGAESPAAEKASTGHRIGGDPKGSSGLAQILGQVTGTSDSGGMGLLLPLLMIAVAVAAVAFVLARRQTEASPR